MKLIPRDKFGMRQLRRQLGGKFYGQLGEQIEEQLYGQLDEQLFEQLRRHLY